MTRSRQKGIQMGQAHRQAGICTIVRVAAPMLITLALFAATAAGASAKLTSHGQLLKLGALHANTNTSTNWFGYNQGTLEKNDTLFNSITGDWTVPTATQHTSGQAESSSDWIGIGGGCVDSGCTVSDSTLIQTGTEQDVDSNCKASASGMVGARASALDHDLEHDRVARRPHARLARRGRSWISTCGRSRCRTSPATSRLPRRSHTRPRTTPPSGFKETPLDIETDAGFGIVA